MKRPAFQFYPADWRKDMALQSCSVAARGLWIDMMCIAHECEPYGHLTVNGKPMTAAQIGRHTGLTERECAKLINELTDAGVASINDAGIMFSRRMVRDEEARETRAEVGRANGAKGAEHGKKGADYGGLGGRPKKATNPAENPPEEPGQKPPQNPLPSSSSSSSEEKTETRKRAPVSVSVKDMEADGVDPQHAAEWMAVRKAKRLPLTLTGWDDTKAEATKAGLTAGEAVRLAVSNGWAGFKASWVAGLQNGRNGQTTANASDIFAGAM